MSCVITASGPTNDHDQIILYIMDLQTAGLCYVKPLKNCIFTSCEYSFETKIKKLSSKINVKNIKTRV